MRIDALTMRIDALCILRPFMVFLACIFAEVFSQQLSHCQSASMGNLSHAWQVRWSHVKPIDFKENHSTDSEKGLVGFIEFPTLNFQKCRCLMLFADVCCICEYLWISVCFSHPGMIDDSATEHPPGTEHCSFHGAACAAWALCAAGDIRGFLLAPQRVLGTSTGGS